MQNPRRMLPWLVAGAIIALDQLTKWIVRQNFPLVGDGVPVIPGLLDFRYVSNTGAAWGSFSGQQIPLVIFSVLMLVVLIWRRKIFLGDVSCRNVILGLLIGGITGNMIDRIFRHFVVDFIDFYHGRWHFPAFNVADSAICIGVGLYLLVSWRCGGKTDGQGTTPVAGEK
jgi:signal peptidase II